MPNCLGLYIEDNIIKYAKVAKDKETLKVEAYGVKFYDKIDKAIEQIISETYSQRTQISINCNGETYNYFKMFSLLSKKDLDRAIKTEFEAYCDDKGYNPNAFEVRYAIAEDKEDKDKLKVLHISENKIELNKRTQLLEGYQLRNVSPISVSIPNLLDRKIEENCIIVNIEDKTTITTVLKNKIQGIDFVEEGSQDILGKINMKENSYSKAYEILKNTTIYTSEGRDLTETNTSYLEDVMPTLYQVVSKVMKVMNTSLEKIQKVYITGTGSLINNIDLYFQEYLTETECEILKPYFIEKRLDINLKDYIEVNSAISLALMGLNEGIAGMNFKANSFTDKLPDWLKIEVGNEKTGKEKKNQGGWFTNDLNQKLDRTEKQLLRVCGGLLLFTIIYSAFAITLDKKMDEKIIEAKESQQRTMAKIQLAKRDDEKLKTNANEYKMLIKSLEDANDKITDRNKSRNSIPNLLNQIMTVVPIRVQITSIENVAGNHIVINAKSDKYEQLGFLKAKIKSERILDNVISTAGEKENDVVSVKIEGDLP